MYRTALVLGIIFSALGVVFGAFGAHALKPLLTPDQAQTFETAVRYQVYHGLALLLAGIIHAHLPNRLIRVSATLFTLGILLFSGSLYLLTALKLNGQVGLGGLGMITPIGGLCFISAWLSLLMGVLKKG